ncbi:hypothetical protein [Oceanobacillus sp. FSL H7-0719]|uniref:hypothetical protein n=1 Tax=Oceanobacillus sp. FSL H7-0719 TaxID=2954507 RepID=UPI003247BB39
MSRKEGVFAFIIAILILSAFIIPFTVLSTIEKWYGSFLFWTLLTIIVIGMNYILIRNWGKEE